MRVPGFLGATFGQEPLVFAVALVRDFRTQFRVATERAASRLGAGTITRADVTVGLVIRRDDDDKQAAARVLLWACNFPQLFADELLRVATGAQEGPPNVDGEPDISYLQLVGRTAHDAFTVAKINRPGSPGTFATVAQAAVPALQMAAPVALPQLFELADLTLREPERPTSGTPRVESFLGLDKPTWFLIGAYALVLCLLD